MSHNVSAVVDVSVNFSLLEVEVCAYIEQCPLSKSLYTSQQFKLVDMFM